MIDCTGAEAWAEVLWCLDRLIAGRPDDGSLHEDRFAWPRLLSRWDLLHPCTQEVQDDPGSDARWPGRTVIDVDLRIGTV